MNKIRLPRDGAEYALFFFTDLPDGATFEAQIGGGSWHALDMTGAVPRLLLRGPDATGGGVLVAADGEIRARVTAAPEIIVRGAGYVSLVS